VRRVAMLSVHTSPLDPPGGGDAGGMNVYVVETAKRLADAGIEVDIFTRATASSQPPSVQMHPGVFVRHVVAGPFEGIGKDDLPAQMCAFAAAVQRAEVSEASGRYDVIHSHYWLSGQVGWLARDRWGVPLVHSAHTLGKVKNMALADGDKPEPQARIFGEEQVVAESDRLVASTQDEAQALIEHYGAHPSQVVIVPPGVDLAAFQPGPLGARRRLGIDQEANVLLFAGRLQPLKAPDVLIQAAAELRAKIPSLPLKVIVVGAPSGSGLADPLWLHSLRSELGLDDVVEFHPPVGREELADYYRAADLTVVPSYNESFGLVALESQACGTPVVAADVGGLSTAVADGRSGVLIDGHDPVDWSRVFADLLTDPLRLADLSTGARAHAEAFSWQRTTDLLIQAYTHAASERRQPAMSRR